eukprot:8143025-Pyramimonas_sp.AAC.1
MPFESEIRAARRGFPLASGMCGALVEMRADLLEFQQSLGFRRWDNLRAPCFCCNCSRDELFSYPLTLDACEWVDKDTAMYDAMVQDAVK